MVFVMITICGVICGADNWVDIENYGHAKQQWLKQFLELPHGIPSHDTLMRVFARLKPEQLQQCFLNWIQAVSQITQGQVIAIDGKSLRSALERGQNRGAIHMVSAWATENRLVLGQQKVNAKSNERQCREVAKLPPKLQPQAWLSAISKAGNKVPPSKIVKEVVVEIKGKPKMESKPKRDRIVSTPGMETEYLIYSDRETYKLLQAYRERVGAATNNGAIRRLLDAENQRKS